MDALEGNVSKLANSLDALLQSGQDGPLGDGVAMASPTAGGLERSEVVGEPADGRTEAVGLWQTPPPSNPSGALADRCIVDPFHDAMLPGTPEIVIDGLPRREVLLDLADVFFTKIHDWCPLFDQTTFKASMFSKGREILLHGLVVVSVRFADETIAEMDRERQVKHSRDQVLLRSMDRCDLISTQALALLAVDALGRGTGPHCWNAMCMLVTAARHLGIATNPLLVTAESSTPLVRNDDEEPGGQGNTAIEVDERQRLFWVICSLDRFSSVAHGQPGGIDTRSIRMPYPSCSAGAGITTLKWFDGNTQWNATAAKDSPSVWHHYIDLLAFSDRCNQLLIQPVNLFLPAHSQDWQSRFRSLDADLASWVSSLPQRYREQPQTFDTMATLLFANIQL